MTVYPLVQCCSFEFPGMMIQDCILSTGCREGD